MKILNVFTISTTPQAFFDGQFRYLVDAGNDIWVISASEEPVQFVKANSITYRRFDIRRSISPLADLRTIAALSAFIRREHFDAVVGHTPKGAMIAMIAALLAGTRNRIYYRHGLIYTTAKGLRRTIFKTVERLTALCSTAIVNVSPSLSQLAVTDRLNPARKQHVIGCGTCGGIDTAGLFNPALISADQRTQLKQSLGIAHTDFVVGFCGRLCKDKGIRELIDGFNLFQQHNPASKLLLVGPYDTRDILPPEYRHQIETNPAIIATGAIDKSQLPLYYSVMDLFLFPSYREGFGMCVIEASAMEIPVLVSRSHGCIDSIREHLTGEYIDISPVSISSALGAMSADPVRRRSLGENGRRFVAREFDCNEMWPKIAKFFTDTLRPPRHA